MPSSPPQPSQPDASDHTMPPWTVAALFETLHDRATGQKARYELHVDYYRIGHTLAFPLPVAARPAALPPGIPNLAWYPWLTWLLWELEERWRTLHASWRLLDDEDAGCLLQRELAALYDWDGFSALDGSVSLCTGHVAAVLAHCLADPTGWDKDLLARARRAAQRVLDADLAPWFAQTWATPRELTPRDIHNIPVIALVRGAHLARVIGSPHAHAMEARSLDVLRTWWRFRVDPDAPHTEGTAYDGYLMDHCLEWLAHLPDAANLLAEGHDAWCDLLRHWVHATLPGRPHLHAPLGDVEPEMPFWMTCMARLCTTLPPGEEVNAGTWLLRRITPAKLPAAALAQLLAGSCDNDLPTPTTQPQHLANVVTLRTGWQQHDTLVLIGLSRSSMSHLHDDGGHLIVARHGRAWITDPGYQQYRPGEERDFTVGPAAHNAPVIDGIVQDQRRARLLDVTLDDSGRQHAAVDLTAAYSGLPPQTQIERRLWLLPDTDEPTVVVCDTLHGLAPAATIATHWQGAAHLAWAFVDGWARLSDGEHALWICASAAPVTPSMLQRHAGSRGSLTLHHHAPPVTDGRHWWVFHFAHATAWSPPDLRALLARVHVE